MTLDSTVDKAFEYYCTSADLDPADVPDQPKLLIKAVLKALTEDNAVAGTTLVDGVPVQLETGKLNLT